MFDRLILSAALKRWRLMADRAATAGPEELRAMSLQARRLRAQLDRLLHRSRARLALPVLENQAFPRPHNTDWAWRPALWCGPLDRPGIASVEPKETLGDEVTVFHDCSISEITLRQLRNQREADLAAYGLRLDVFRFDGSYLSLAIDLPLEAGQSLTRDHLIRVNTIIEMEKPLEIFARLNIQHGPNTEQLVRELPLQQEDIHVEFDMAYTKMNEKRVERLWLDLIFEGPELNQVILRDLTFCRLPRAAL